MASYWITIYNLFLDNNPQHAVYTQQEFHELFQDDRSVMITPANSRSSLKPFMTLSPDHPLQVGLESKLKTRELNEKLVTQLDSAQILRPTSRAEF
jgi:hypothetical protein